MLFSGIAFCLSLLAVIPAAAYPSLYRECVLPVTGGGNHQDPLEPDGWVAAPRILSTFINKYDGARIAAFCFPCLCMAAPEYSYNIYSGPIFALYILSGNVCRGIRFLLTNLRGKTRSDYVPGRNYTITVSKSAAASLWSLGRLFGRGGFRSSVEMHLCRESLEATSCLVYRSCGSLITCGTAFQVYPSSPSRGIMVADAGSFSRDGNRVGW